MRKIAIGLIAILFFITNLCAQSVSYSQDIEKNHIISFEVGDYSLEKVEFQGNAYTKINYNHKVVTSKNGFAELPLISKSIELSAQDDLSLAVVDSLYTEIKLEFPLLPSRGSMNRSQNILAIPYAIAENSLTDDWYPKRFTELSNYFWFREFKGVTLISYPFVYKASSQTLRIYQKFTVKLSRNQQKLNSAPFTHKENKNRTAKEFANSIFINRQQTLAKSRSKENFLSEDGDILVIHTKRDLEAVNKFVAWKRAKGFQVEVVEVGVETKVKSLIQDAYSANSNLLYVQLFGGWNDLKSDVFVTTNLSDLDNGAPLDPLLGCVVGDDKYPDLIVGRFVGNTLSDMLIQVEKSINYEKNPSTDNLNWYQSALGIGSNEGGVGMGDDGEVDFEHIDIISQQKLNPYGFHTLYEAYKYPEKSIVTNALNSGVSLINYTGHGSNYSWGTTGFSNNDIAALKNQNMLPVINSVACINGAFHLTEPTFAQHWLTKVDGGAVATLMSSVYQDWLPPMVGQDYFNDIYTGGYDYSSKPGNGTNIYQEDSRTTFGAIALNSNILMLSEAPNSDEYIKTISSWTIFGDASLQVRNSVPSTLSLSSEEVLFGQKFDIVVSQNGKALAGVRVTISSNGRYFTDLSDEQGLISINHYFKIGDKVLLVVTGYNDQTIYKELTVLERSIICCYTDNSKPFELLQNYPNPFNNQTTISFNLPINDMVKLSLYNHNGQLIKELLNQNLSAGPHSVNLSGDKLSSGIYIYRLQTSNKNVTKSMLLVK